MAGAGGGRVAGGAPGDATEDEARFERRTARVLAAINGRFEAAAAHYGGRPFVVVQ